MENDQRGHPLRVFGMPVHPAIVHLPIVLLPAAFICDLTAMATGDGFWSAAGWYALLVGLVAGSAAAIAGLIDYRAIPGETTAKSFGAWHMVINLTVLSLFAVASLGRVDGGHAASVFAMVLEGIGASALMVSGTLGGIMVFRHGVGQERGEVRFFGSAHIPQPLEQAT